MAKGKKPDSMPIRIKLNLLSRLREYSKGNGRINRLDCEQSGTRPI